MLEVRGAMERDKLRGQGLTAFGLDNYFRLDQRMNGCRRNEYRSLLWLQGTFRRTVATSGSLSRKAIVQFQAASRGSRYSFSLFSAVELFRCVTLGFTPQLILAVRNPFAPQPFL